MKNIINELLAINYVNYNDIPNYREKAYEILDKLTKSELLDLVGMEKMTWINKNANKESLKYEIYDYMVRFRCDIQVLGEVAAHSYKESLL